MLYISNKLTITPQIGSEYYFNTRTGEDPAGTTRDLVFFSGVTIFDLYGGDGVWKFDELYFIPSVNKQYVWNRIDGVTPTVSLASIYNQDEAVYAGWNVDAVKWENNRGKIALRCTIGCSDKDGHLYRAAYHIVAVGELKRPLTTVHFTDF